jgi:aryl-alcohol dehydrogenase-like predicted oxidoreductase
MLDRREFLAVSLAGAVAMKADAAPRTAKGEWRNRQSGMAYRQLGRTGFMISEVVMGGNTISPTNYEHVLAAMDRGLNYLDTAPAYGNTESEKGYAKVIRARKRDQFFLNSKVSVWDSNRSHLFQNIFDSLDVTTQKKLRTKALDEIAKRKADETDHFIGYFGGQRAELDQAYLANVMEAEYGRRIDRNKNYKRIIWDSVEATLRRLGTDHLDILMCPHGASTPVELTQYPEIGEACAVLKRAGKVRHIGVSAHTDPAGILTAAAKSDVYSVAMVAYNVVNHPYVAKALAAAHKKGLGVIAMKVARPVFAGRPNGPDTPARQAMIDAAVPGGLKRPLKAYSWALRNPNLSAVISEMVNQSMVDDNLQLAVEKKPA